MGSGGPPGALGGTWRLLHQGQSPLLISAQAACTAAGTQVLASLGSQPHLTPSLAALPPSPSMPGTWVLLLLGLRLQTSLGVIPVEEESPAFWNRKAAQALDAAKKLQPIETAAKNLILFLGDGE